MSYPTGAVEIVKELKKNGFECYFVGGCVRDFLMGIEPHDFDLTTNATPDAVMKIFPKCYATGLQHGTVTVHQNDGDYEVTTYRTEGVYTDNRHPDEVFFVNNIEEDLARRDLTINAIAYDITTNTYVDPFDGKGDIIRQVIRAVGNPYDRFNEDALRMMRVFRFASRFGFDIDQTTEQATWDLASNIANISGERFWKELSETLKADATYVYRMRHLLNVVGIPVTESEQSALTSIAHMGKYYSEPVAMAILLHQTGFYETTALEDILGYLHLTRKEHDMIVLLVNHGMEHPTHVRLDVMHDLFVSFHYTKEQVYNMIKMQEYYFSKSNDYIKDKLSRFAEFCKNRPLTTKDLAINGKDVMNITGAKGKQVGYQLQKVLSYVFVYPEYNNREALLAYLENN